MKNPAKVALAACALAAVPVVAGCGSGGSLPGVSASSQPSWAKGLRAGVTVLAPHQVSAGNDSPGAVNGDQALVGTTGTFCVQSATPPCYTNTDPAAIFDSGKSFATLWSQAGSASGNSYALIQMIEVDGGWYIDSGNP